MTMRIVPEDEIAYARERVVAWCSKAYPHMTLGQVQHLAILIAVERQKATVAADPSPRRLRRICEPEGLPITLPAVLDAKGVNPDEEDTEPRTKWKP
jgi:hypothetical protein